MMRSSSYLRRHRWGVFIAWLLLLVPAIFLTLHESEHLTGGGFEVAGSQSLHVQYQLQDHFPDQGASPLALVAAPRGVDPCPVWSLPASRNWSGATGVTTR